MVIPISDIPIFNIIISYWNWLTPCLSNKVIEFFYLFFVLSFLGGCLVSLITSWVLLLSYRVYNLSFFLLKCVNSCTKMCIYNFKLRQIKNASNTIETTLIWAIKGELSGWSVGDSRKRYANVCYCVLIPSSLLEIC